MLYIILAILMFGLLIAVHEFDTSSQRSCLGSRSMNFPLNGPRSLEKRKGETLYSLRVLPIGGYRAMEGRMRSPSNPRPLATRRPGSSWWCWPGSGDEFPHRTADPPDPLRSGPGLPDPGVQRRGARLWSGGLRAPAGDRFLSVDGHRVLGVRERPLYLNRAGDRVDLVVERNGEKFRLDGVYLPYQTRVDENGTRLSAGDQHRLGGGPAHGGQQASLCLNTAVDLYPHGVAQPWRAGPGCGGPAGSVRPSGDREYHVPGGEPVAHSC